MSRDKRDADHSERAGAARANLRFLPVRDDIILVETGDLSAARALYGALKSDPIPAVRQVIPAARTVQVTFDPAALSARQLAVAISSRAKHSTSVETGPLIDIPVIYDGEDIDELAATLGLTRDELIERHTGSDYFVAFTGFAPGFAYLAGGDPKLNAPRRSTPRTQVPAGSVGLAGEFSGIYPKTSPGGWRLIGRTPLDMFDLNRDPAALLQPGSRVKFRQIDEVESDTMRRPPAAAAKSNRPPTAAPTAGELIVIASAFPILFQDLGRPGFADQGVSLSGAADKTSLSLANQIAGNSHGAPALEITAGQAQFRAVARSTIVLCGAPAPIIITPANGTIFSAPMGRPIALEDGDLISIGAPDSGLRTYLAARGGFNAKRVLGSASTDTLAQIGPAPLKAGDQIELGKYTSEASRRSSDLPTFAMPRRADIIELDVVMGPRTDWFTPESIEQFASQIWRVTPQSNRIGLRLDGAPLERLVTRELPSEAAAQGAIQIPADGKPVLFLADHPLTGGYPVIANVVRRHLDLAGQIPLGAQVRFVPVGPFVEI